MVDYQLAPDVATLVSQLFPWLASDSLVPELVVRAPTFDVPPVINRATKPVLNLHRLSISDYISDQAPTVVSPETLRLAQAVYPEVVESHGPEVVSQVLLERHYRGRSSDSSSVRERSRTTSPGVRTSFVYYQPFESLSFEPYCKINQRHCVITSPAFLIWRWARKDRLELWAYDDNEEEFIVAKFAVSPVFTVFNNMVYTHKRDSRLTEIQECSFNFAKDVTLQVRIPSGSKYMFPTPPL